ncbi:MAG: peptidoglycan-binding protein [Actinomycetales bacterium]|nr:peptidoglycan-binding protein [Actinomycetales bacterium]
MEGRGAVRRGLWRAVAAVVGIAAVGAAGFWAGRETLEPPTAQAQVADSFVDVDVTVQQVGRVLTLSTTARRASTPLAVNALAGTVTQVAADGEHRAGDVLYTVGATPVVLVAGTTPFWRDLGPGDTGADVAQVQRFLASTGTHLTADGRWGSATTAALERWQKQRGAAITGTVALGTMVASPAMPVTVDLDASVLWPGATLSGGETPLTVPAGDPVFVMQLTSTQAAMVPAGTRVTVHADGADWPGVAGDPTTSDTGVDVPVTAPDGTVLCGQDCGLLPTSQVYLLTEVAVREPVTGPVVPVAAVTTEPDGTTSVAVVGEGGTTRAVPVHVQTVADGLAVVDGVRPGDRVRVFGSTGAVP